MYLLEGMFTLLTLVILSFVQVQGNFYGHDYYNDRYGVHGIAYTDGKNLSDP